MLTEPAMARGEGCPLVAWVCTSTVRPGRVEWFNGDKTMGWKSSFGGLTLLLTILVGCKGRVFLTEDQANIYKGMVPANLDQNPNVGANPTIPMVGAPPTLYNLERQIRYLSLAEAVSIALEQGTVGQPSLLFPGIGLDNLIAAPQGSAPSGSDSIRVLAMDPATTAANIDASLAKFDAVVGSSMIWNTTDQPIASALQNLQAGGSTSGINAIVQEQAQFQSGIYKPLPTGGVAGITFTVPYTFTNLPARINPSYQPSLQFQFEQPLLQGFGVEINQLRAFHPGSIIPFSPPNSLTGPPAAQYLPVGFNNTSGVGLGVPPGILIARIRFNQNRAEFERNVNQMLLNVENAYWNLFGSYWQLYSREQGLRFAYEAWKIVGAKYKVGRVSLADFAQAEGQYNLFRSQRLQAIDTVLDNERQLRAIMGMQIEDGTRLVPSDAPTLAEYRPNWETALVEALQNRPELYMARQDVKVAQLQRPVGQELSAARPAQLRPVRRQLHRHSAGQLDLQQRRQRLPQPGLQHVQRLDDWPAPGDAAGLPLRPCAVAPGPAAAGSRLLRAAGSGAEGRAFPGSVLSPHVVGLRPDQGGPRPARGVRHAVAASATRNTGPEPRTRPWTCCWRRSASGPTPWPPSTRPSSPTTTPSPASSTPRARSCSTIT